MICYNVIILFVRSVREGKRDFYLLLSEHSLMDNTSSEEISLSAMESKTLQELVLSFRLINSVSQLKKQEETPLMEPWDTPVKAKPA